MRANKLTYQLWVKHHEKAKLPIYARSKNYTEITLPENRERDFCVDNKSDELILR